MKTTKTKTPAGAKNRHVIPSRVAKSTTHNPTSAPSNVGSHDLMAFVRQLYALTHEYDARQNENPPLTPAAKARFDVLCTNLTSITKLSLTPKETAALLSISERSLTRLWKERKLLIPVIALSSPRYSMESIMKFLRDNTASPGTGTNAAH